MVTIGNVDLVFQGGTLVRRTETEADTRTGGLEVRGITLEIEKNTLLENISFSARPGTLTAVIGPSGAGKSTLAKVVVGATSPTEGRVSFEGHDIHAEYASLRSRIGMVPQDDVVHGSLTVNQALGYAAELRLPPDTTKEDRRQVIDQVLEELELIAARGEARGQALRRPAQTRVGGHGAADRSVAADPRRTHIGSGPRAGPPGDDHVASTRRRRPHRRGGDALADLSRRVRPSAAAGAGGKDRILRAAQRNRPAMGTTNWADIFSTVASDPEGAKLRFLERHAPPPALPETR